jgi:hypothetical protein
MLIHTDERRRRGMNVGEVPVLKNSPAEAWQRRVPLLYAARAASVLPCHEGL